MTIVSICLYGVVEKKPFQYDSYDGDFDVKHAKIFICNLAGKIIDNLSKSGFVDVDIEYGQLDQIDQNKIMDYTIEFFVNDKYKGYMTILVTI